MANQRATTISLRQLGSAVDKALKIAVEKHGAQFEGGAGFQFIPNWQILGRILREADLANAQTIANEVTNSLNQSLATGPAEVRSAAATTPTSGSAGGGNFEPVVLWNGRHIICGARPAPQVEFGE